MKDREHDDSMSLGAEEHGVGEAARLYAPYFLALDGKTFRMICRKFNGAVDLRHELPSETGTPFFVPLRGGIELGPRCTPKDDL